MDLFHQIHFNFQNFDIHTALEIRDRRETLENAFLQLFWCRNIITGGINATGCSPKVCYSNATHVSPCQPNSRQISKNIALVV